MQKVTFKVIIDTTPEKLWNLLWDDATYRKWTSAFFEGSYMESDWKVGGRTLFLDRNGNGMVSTIDAIEPNKYLSFKHLGMINNGVENLDSEEVKKWSGSKENYILNRIGEKTELSVEQDLDEEYKTSFNNTWQKAFDLIKSLVDE